MAEKCPNCGSARVRSEHLDEPHPRSEIVVEQEPHDYDRADNEIVIDAETGYVLREPVEHTCERCREEWISEFSLTVEEIEEEMRREQRAQEETDE